MEKLIKKAFTLAEVLITLTIIGVIAALTVPTLISNAHDHAIVAKLKKAQSVLANAIKMYESENGPISEFSSNGYHEYITAEKLLPYMKGRIIEETDNWGNDLLITEDGFVYGFHADYNLSVTVDKFDETKNQFYQKDGTTFWFEYTDKSILKPYYTLRSSYDINYAKNQVCPDNSPHNICTDWTLITGKVKKKQGEWID